MDCSTPGFPVLHYLPELAQTHVHRVSDANHPSHPLPPSSPPAFSLSQQQGLFQWIGSSHQVASGGIRRYQGNISCKHGHNKGQKRQEPNKQKRLRRGGKNTQNYTKKAINDPDDHNGVVMHLQPDIQECVVTWALGSIEWRWWNSSWVISNSKMMLLSAALKMSANLENFTPLFPYFSRDNMQ